MKDKVIATREYREHLLKDPYRPTYHFAIPDDCGGPGDPNGAFFADGIYHLMYLYKNSKTNGFHWGHISSKDLLHWRNHPDALTVYEGDEGCFSGGGFLDDDNTAYLTFWKFAAKDESKDRSGIAIAYAKPPYDEWKRIEPIAVNATEWGIKDVEINGETVHLACADPSNIWKMNGYYYMELGNLMVLNKYGREENSSKKYQGDWTELYRSKDLHHWEYVHRFYENTHMGSDWPDETEDAMRSSFLPLYDAKQNGKLTGKWLQMFISHNKGCQYYVGTLKNEKFYPEFHGRMSWNDRTYFAPEALIDDKNRHIVWTWILDNLGHDFDRFGWSGVYAFPRLLWWENEKLHIAPADELDNLQYNHQEFTNLEDNVLNIKNGESFRIKAIWNIKKNDKAGFKVRVSNNGNEYTEIYIDKKSKTLVMDTSNSGISEWFKIKEESPFELDNDELLYMDIFVDKSVIEVFVNERQAISRRAFPSEPQNSLGVEVIGDVSEIKKLDAWEMASTNPY